MYLRDSTKRPWKQDIPSSTALHTRGLKENNTNPAVKTIFFRFSRINIFQKSYNPNISLSHNTKHTDMFNYRPLRVPPQLSNTRFYSYFNVIKYPFFYRKHQDIPCAAFSSSISRCFSSSGRKEALAALNVWKEIEKNHSIDLHVECVAFNWCTSVVFDQLKSKVKRRVI